ncbi:hypothetical protein M422DRAFT_55669 [Sphaerobolus stellatus SS14]|uniref:Uncharacterized protein n=2 Tax=Sphaerobolus stellatus (strain SS14) TaxID=990650 RepID=A0A0C9UAM4_SPHS4|nr:hypothetical protein M422DRAFT_55669 [Sphaerobolus stellatus SS14]
MIEVDKGYLKRIPEPIAAWGRQLPHDPATGIFKLAATGLRTFPTKTDDDTHEYIHPSVLSQTITIPEVTESIKANPALLCDLDDMGKMVRSLEKVETTPDDLDDAEHIVKETWPYVAGKDEFNVDVVKEHASQEAMKKSLEKMQAAADSKRLGRQEIMTDEGGRPRYGQTWLGSIWHAIIGDE